MAIIRDSISTSVLTVDSGSKSIRVIPYSQQGLEISNRATFRAATASSFLVNASLQLAPFFTIYGSTTKIIKISKIGICITSSSNDRPGIEITKRSSLPTGAGLTSNVPLIATPMDSKMASATTSLLQIYNGGTLPVAGKFEGRIKRRLIFVTIEGSEDVSEYLFDFRDKSGLYYQPPTLRGPSEGIDIMVTGDNNSTSLNTTMYVEWTEENK